MSPLTKAAAGLGIATIFFCMPIYHTGQRFIHWITEPDKTICVQSHYNYIWQSGYVISTGKTTEVVPGHMTPIFICDKEAPNPDYAKQMEKWRNK